MRKGGVLILVQLLTSSVIKVELEDDAKEKNFALRRQLKHTSPVMDSSHPFHTLAKLGDVEDIANKKLRTFDQPSTIVTSTFCWKLLM